MLALLGPRCPDQLRAFLLALSIVDDIGAVGAIALFYIDDVQVLPLVLAGVVFVALLGLLFLRFWRTPIYVLIGVVMWLAVLESGVHPSVVGVAIGLLVNAYAPRPHDIARAQMLGGSMLIDPSPARALAAPAAVNEVVSPNERLQLRIQPWSSYVIVPLFVLANAGVVRPGAARRRLLAADVGDRAGRTVGKLVGVTAGTWVALRTGIGRVPDTLRWGQLIGGAGLAGIGFTVALFVTDLALDDPVPVNDAKIGSLAGSIRPA